jgi:2-oxoglutarate ferredoxin oxidoreductase subunit delta
MNPAAPIRILEDRCKGCGLCGRACPLRLLHLGKELNTAGYAVVRLLQGGAGNARCTGCMACALVCPDCAILASG